MHQLPRQWHVTVAATAAKIWQRLHFDFHFACTQVTHLLFTKPGNRQQAMCNVLRVTCNLQRATGG